MRMISTTFTGSLCKRCPTSHAQQRAVLRSLTVREQRLVMPRSISMRNCKHRERFYHTFNLIELFESIQTFNSSYLFLNIFSTKFLPKLNKPLNPY